MLAPCLPLIAAWLWGAGHSADGFAAVWRGLLSPLVRWRWAGGFEASLGARGISDSATTLYWGWGQAVCCCRRGSCISALPARSQHRAPPVSGWWWGGWRCASPWSRRTSALGRPGGTSLASWGRALCRRARHLPLLWRQRWGAVAALDRGRITSRGWRSAARWWRRRPKKHKIKVIKK